MKKIYTSLAIMILLTLTISPRIAEASWWNPFTWFTPKVKEKPVTDDFERIKTQTEDNLEVKTLNTESISVKKQILNIKPEDKRVIPEAQKILSNNKNFPLNINTKEGLNAKFEQNPTLENFKTVCNLTKNVKSEYGEKILDKTRENIVEVKRSIFDERGLCQAVLNGRKGTLFLPLDNNLLVDLSNNDSEDIRKAKINYNNKVKTLIKTSKANFTVFIFNPNEKHNVYSPKDLFNIYINQINLIEKELKNENIEVRDKIRFENDIRDIIGKMNNFVDSFRSLKNYFINLEG